MSLYLTEFIRTLSHSLIFSRFDDFFSLCEILAVFITLAKHCTIPGFLIFWEIFRKKRFLCCLYWYATFLSVQNKQDVYNDFCFQFVPFRDYIDRSGNQVLSMARLAKDVLAEIPDQLLSFMKSRGIEPRPALSSSPLPQLHRHI